MSKLSPGFIFYISCLSSFIHSLSFSAGLEGLPRVCFLPPHCTLVFCRALSAVCRLCRAFLYISTGSSSFMIVPFHYGLFPVHQFNAVFNLWRTCISYSLISALINIFQHLAVLSGPPRVAGSAWGAGVLQEVCACPATPMCHRQTSPWTGLYTEQIYACMCMHVCVGGSTHVLQVGFRKCQNNRQPFCSISPSLWPATDKLGSQQALVVHVCGSGAPDWDSAGPEVCAEWGWGGSPCPVPLGHLHMKGRTSLLA